MSNHVYILKVLENIGTLLPMRNLQLYYGYRNSLRINKIEKGQIDFSYGTSSFILTPRRLPCEHFNDGTPQLNSIYQ